PGPAALVLTVKNLGNVEDSYSATIVETTGPLSADFIGLDGEPTITIPTFQLPGLSTSVILVGANLTASGQGTVKIKVASLDHPNLFSIVTATVTTNPSGMSMDCSPLHVGLNTCTILGASPGGLVGLAMGTHAGTAQLSPFNITVGMTDGKVVAQGIV